MKHKMFSIRNVARNTPSAEENILNTKSIEMISIPEIPQENQMSKLMTMFESFLKVSGKQQSNPKRVYEVQARDRQVMIPLPDIANSKITSSDLKAWVANVIKTVCSTAFNYFFKKEISYEQAKVFCSENILKNIVVLSQAYSLSAEELELIDSHVKKGVLSYLGTKYPLTESNEINKRLQQIIHQIDNIEDLSNNYFANSKVIFEYRDSGNYNDLIMLVLNDLMNIIEDENEDEKSNYMDFQAFMASLFEKVEDEDWMIKDKNHLNNSHLKLIHQQSDISSPTLEKQHSANLSKQEIQEMKEKNRRRIQQKEKYKSKVKEYTQVLIGRKIPENTPTFTQNQIQNGNITIKSPTILRILTKWCGQLQQKYSNSYFSNRSESVKVQKGSNVNSLLAWMRKNIDEKLQVSIKQINKSMTQIFKNNYQMQSKILQNQLQFKGEEHIDEIEKISGKFSCKVVKNLHIYIITYLNKLIHGLLKASKQFFEQSNIFDYSLWPSPPNLLTFKIGDLMRCKCTSKEKQIIKIYKQLHRISKQSPQKLKIIRIKNRLRSGTNDILMNIRFNNQITCEIQLGIKSKVSDFIKCSNLFHHYLYELERSIFGPMTELCSIWNSLDRRTDIYLELVEEEQFTVDSKEHSCSKLKKRFEMVPYDKPFVCNHCNHTYYHNNYLKNHVVCNLCSYFLCAKCVIDQFSEDQLKCQFIEDAQQRALCKAKLNDKNEIPQKGICILIEAKEPKCETFSLLTYQNKKYLLGRKGNDVYQIYKLNNKKRMKSFRKKYIVFELEKSWEIEVKEARNKYILPLLMIENFKKQKESLNLMDLELTTEECSQILSVGSKSQKQNVKNLFLVDNQITELPFDPQEFPNISWLTLSRNPIQTFKGISQLKRLKNLICVSCQLSEFPPQIYDCRSIEHLSLPYTTVSSFDERIINLKCILSLQLSGNSIISVPQYIYECSTLKSLKFDNNQLTQIPDGIGKLKNLQHLSYNTNQLTTISQEVGELQKLRQIFLGKNYSLALLPQSLANLSKIEMLDLSSTIISIIPMGPQGWPNLRLLNISETQVASPPNFINSKKLQILIVNNIYSFEFSDNFNYQGIKILQANSIGINAIPQYFQRMTQLQTLKLEGNTYISEIPLKSFLNIQILLINGCNFGLLGAPQLPDCLKLKKLDISTNNISSLPASICKYQLLQQFICTNNGVAHLPSSMIKMTKLTLLDLKYNSITTLFEQQTETMISGDHNIKWPNLKSAYLANNQLEDIPLILCNSPLIVDLFMSSNNIKRLRPQIKGITSLKQIQFNYNQIQQFPIELLELHNLTGIFISANRITKIPSFIKDLPNLVNFYVDLMQIQEIDCIDWVISADNVNVGTLKDAAFRMKFGEPVEEVNYYQEPAKEQQTPQENEEVVQIENTQEKEEEIQENSDP